jgi:hypothetical protein
LASQRAPCTWNKKKSKHNYDTHRMRKQAMIWSLLFKVRISTKLWGWKSRCGLEYNIKIEF